MLQIGYRIKRIKQTLLECSTSFYTFFFQGEKNILLHNLNAYRIFPNGWPGFFFHFGVERDFDWW